MTWSERYASVCVCARARRAVPCHACLYMLACMCARKCARDCVCARACVRAWTFLQIHVFVSYDAGVCTGAGMCAHSHSRMQDQPKMYVCSLGRCSTALRRTAVFAGVMVAQVVIHKRACAPNLGVASVSLPSDCLLAPRDPRALLLFKTEDWPEVLARRVPGIIKI